MSVLYLQAFGGRQSMRDEGDKLVEGIEMASKVSLSDIFPLTHFFYFLSSPRLPQPFLYPVFQ